MDYYKITTCMIIGITEGITEFLPISSTGHMIIIFNFLEIENHYEKMLEIFVQLGSASAIFCFFYKKILQIFNVNITTFQNNKKNIHIFLAIAPTVLMGLIFYKQIKLLYNINNIIYSLISGSVLLIICEILKPKKNTVFYIDHISILQSFIIGILQCLSLYPGFSRSGATISTGILLGLKRSVAIEFSFIVSIPLLIGASLFDFFNNINYIQISDCPIFLIGFVTSFSTALFVMSKLLKLINKTSLIFFAIYRIIIAMIVYVNY